MKRRIKRLTYCFDLDGTLCTLTDGSYDRAEPRRPAVARVNRLYRQGHRIVVFTARGSMTGLDWRKVTKRQLKTWGLLHHELLFGKPAADVYVDDKALHAEDWLAGRRPRRAR